MSVRRKPNFDQIPLLTPGSDWRPPEVLPDLRGAGVLAIDIETNDPRLNRGGGAGWAYGDGYITGVAVAWADSSIYIPIRHPDTAGCFPKEVVERWLKHIITPITRVVTHGGAYDWGWLMHEFRLSWPSQLDDTIAMAVMIDENRLSYKLNDVCKWRGIPGKDEQLLKDAALAYSIPPGQVKGNLWRLPARYVGPYAAQDALATLQLRDNLMETIREEHLLDAYETEMSLVPMVHAMRKRGIRVDLDAAARAKGELEAKRDHTIEQIRIITDNDKLGMGDLRKATVLEKLHDAFEISYPRTMKTERGSFTDEWMADHEHQLPRLVSQALKLDSAANKFLQGFVMDFAHKGRLHASINQFRNEDGGTRSHRFSYADPPLQQMPARDTDVAAMIRGCFLPEEGEQWLAADYSQQEYRLIVHYADLLNMRKADVAAQMYRDNPNTDFHNIVVEWTGLDRRQAKNTNFAKAYGAGVTKFATMIGYPRDSEEGLAAAKEIYDLYAREFPFVDSLNRSCQRKAEQRGYVKMFDGARNHFELWEPAAYRPRDVMWGALPRERAEKEWPNQRLRRAGCHKAMNRLIQGSAARQVKIAMKLCFEAGYLPLLQMHDELDFSVPVGETGLTYMDHIRELLIKATTGMSIPMVVDLEYGPTWGEAKNKR